MTAIDPRYTYVAPPPPVANGTVPPNGEGFNLVLDAAGARTGAATTTVTLGGGGDPVVSTMPQTAQPSTGTTTATQPTSTGTGTPPANTGTPSNTSTTPTDPHAGHDMSTMGTTTSLTTVKSPTPGATAVANILGGGGTGQQLYRVDGPRDVHAVRSPGAKTPLEFSIGDASFTFPPLGVSGKSNNAPMAAFGEGWTQKTSPKGVIYFEHTNGTRATPKTQLRISVSRPGKVTIVTGDFGKGKKFPDGTIVGIGKDGKYFKIDPQGNKSTIGFGSHTFGGVKVRLFEAAVMNVVTPDGRFVRYDSRGRMRMGRSLGLRAATIGGGAAQAATASTQPAKGGGPLAAGGDIQSIVNKMMPIISSLLEELGMGTGPSTGGGGKVAGASGGGATTGAKSVDDILGEMSPLLTSIQSMIGDLPAGTSQVVSGAATCMQHHE
jgi:hypothetical protein